MFIAIQTNPTLDMLAVVINERLKQTFHKNKLSKETSQSNIVCLWRKMYEHCNIIIGMSYPIFAAKNMLLMLSLR